MQKTDKMLLIEERAGADIRQVLADAYAEGGAIDRAAAIISERYRVPFTFGLFSDWVEAAGGVYRRQLEFPGFAVEETAGIGGS